MLTLTVASIEFFGIGELWSGIIIGVLVIPVAIGLLVGWIVLADKLGFGSPPEFGSAPTPAGSGVLICDYVDVETLTTTATQSGVEPEPQETERGTTTTRDRSAGLTKGGLTGRFGRSRSEDERKRFLHGADPNLLLSKTLDTLEQKGELTRYLADTPSVSLGDPNLEDQLSKIAEEYAEAKEAREALTNVRARLISSEKRNEFEEVVKGRQFVLVESRWNVARSDGRIQLSLAQLNPGSRYSDWAREQQRLVMREMYLDDMEGAEPPPKPKPIKMPDEIAVVVAIDAAELTKQGESRFPGDGHVSAGVFGTAAAHVDGTLTVSPLAVFARQGVPEEEPADHYPRER
jgi:hypothetical protein